MTDDMRKLLVEFNNGTLSARGLNVELVKLGNTDLGPLGFMIKPFVDRLADAALKAKDLQDVLVGLEHVAAGLGQSQDLQYQLDQRAAGDKSAAAYKLQLQAITALSPAKQGQIAYDQKLLELDGSTLTTARQLQEAEQARSIAVTQAQFAIGRADQARLLAANQNIAAAQVDLANIGKSVSETTRLTFVRQQLASAEAEAAQNGVSVSAGYIAAIQRIGAAYGQLQQQIAEAKLQSDLMFERAQLGRSPIEQTVASQLRPIYGDDVNSAQAKFIAQQVRINETLKETQALNAQIASSMATVFQPFKDWQTTLDGIANSLASIGQQMITKNITSLLNGTPLTPANDNGTGAGGAVAGGLALVGGALPVNLKNPNDVSKGFADLFKNIPGGAATVGAGLGGFGVGYQSQNPLMGAAGGALAGAAAGPWGAVAGGVLGFIGGLLGMNEQLEKSKQALKDNADAIQQFIDTGLGTEISKYTTALTQFTSQGKQLLELAKAAGDSAMTAKIQAAMKTTLGGQFLDDLQRSLNTLRDKSYLNDFSDALKAYNQRLSRCGDARRIGRRRA